MTNTLDGVFESVGGKALAKPYSDGGKRVGDEILCLYANKQGELTATACQDKLQYVCETNPEGRLKDSSYSLSSITHVIFLCYLACKDSLLPSKNSL